MNAEVELALKKQRLQLRSAALRAEFAGHASTLEPWLAAGDRLREGTRWLRRHPALVVGTTVALVVAWPRASFRWLRRGVIAWQAWSRARAWLDDRTAR